MTDEERRNSLAYDVTPEEWSQMHTVGARQETGDMDSGVRFRKVSVPASWDEETKREVGQSADLVKNWVRGLGRTCRTGTTNKTAHEPSHAECPMAKPCGVIRHVPLVLHVPQTEPVRRKNKNARDTRVSKRWCSGRDSNPQSETRPAPQAGVSANSTTRAGL